MSKGNGKKPPTKRRKNDGALRDAKGHYLPGTPTQFQPGNKGGGRPPGTGITDRLRKVLDENQGSVADALVKTAVEYANKGDFRFWNAIVERVEGKVPERIAGHDGGPLIKIVGIEKETWGRV